MILPDKYRDLPLRINCFECRDVMDFTGEADIHEFVVLWKLKCKKCGAMSNFAGEYGDKTIH